MSILKKFSIGIAAAVMIVAAVPLSSQAATLSVVGVQITPQHGANQQGLPVMRVDGTATVTVTFTMVSAPTGTVFVSLPKVYTATGRVAATLLNSATRQYQATFTGVRPQDFTDQHDVYEQVLIQDSALNSATLTAYVADFDAPSAVTVNAPAATRVVNATVAWTPSADFSGIYGYSVQMKNVASGQVYAKNVDAATTSVKTDDLPFDGEVAITVTATDNAGRVSAVSAEKRFTLDRTAPGIPTNLNGSVGRSSTTLTWTGVTDADFALYHVYRDNVEIGTVKDARFVDSGDNFNRYVAYTVAAEDNLGNMSGKSKAFNTEGVYINTNTNTATTPTSTNTNTSTTTNTNTTVIPEVPTVNPPATLTGVVTPTATTLTWSRVSGGIYYRVYRDGVKVVQTKDQLTWADRSVDNVNKTYTYTVRAIGSNGRESKDSMPLKTKKVPAPSVTTRTVTRTVVSAPVAAPVVVEPINENVNVNANISNEPVNVPVALATNTGNENIGGAGQGTVFSAAQIFGSWWFWLAIILIAIAGAIWLYVSRRDDEEEAEVTVPPMTGTQQV